MSINTLQLSHRDGAVLQNIWIQELNGKRLFAMSITELRLQRTILECKDRGFPDQSVLCKNNAPLHCPLCPGNDAITII